MLYLFKCLLFLIIPTLIFPLQSEHPSPINLPKALHEEADRLLLNYDDLLDWVEKIEEAELEGYTSDQIEQIVYFVSFLAWKGAPSNNPICYQELETDIHHLLCDSRSLQTLPYGSLSCSTQPAVYYGELNAILCKSWVKKQCHNVKKFVKKHKTAIIIGVAVVVATVAIVTVVALASASAASSAVATAGAAASELIPDESKDFPSKNSSSISDQEIIAKLQPIDPTQNAEQVLPLAASSPLAQVIEEKTIPIKEALSHEAAINEMISPDPSHNWVLAEKARELSAFATHEILDGLATLGSTVPQAMAEIAEISSRIFPQIEPLQDMNSQPSDPIGAYNDLVQTLHHKIDEVFDTNIADRYSEEANSSDSHFTVGMLPPPSTVGTFAGNLKQLTEAGKALDRGGYSRAGRSLMKKGYRPNSAFQKPIGNPEQINNHGQAMLEKILDHPDKVVSFKTNGRYGKFMDIQAPNLVHLFIKN